MSSLYLEPFLCADPPSFDEMDLVLTPPQRGETCHLFWWVEDGQLVKYRDTIFGQSSDADPGEGRSFWSPLPGRVRILQQGGHGCYPGRIGSLQYGYKLDAFLRREWQELLHDLAAELEKRQQDETAKDISPHELTKLVFLENTLVRTLVPDDMDNYSSKTPGDRQNRALAALSALGRWKEAGVRTAAQNFPADVVEQTLLWWKYLFSNLIADLRHKPLKRKGGLTTDRK